MSSRLILALPSFLFNWQDQSLANGQFISHNIWWLKYPSAHTYQLPLAFLPECRMTCAEVETKANWQAPMSNEQQTDLLKSCESEWDLMSKDRGICNMSLKISPRPPRSKQDEWDKQSTRIPTTVLLIYNASAHTWWHEVAEGPGADSHLQEVIHPFFLFLFVQFQEMALLLYCPQIGSLDKPIPVLDPEMLRGHVSRSLIVFMTLPLLREPSACIKVTSRLSDCHLNQP